MSLKEKLKKLEEKGKERTVNWEEEKRAWLSSVDQLYQSIEKWFLLRVEESENKMSWELRKSTKKFDRKPLDRANLETLFEQWVTV